MKFFLLLRRGSLAAGITALGTFAAQACGGGVTVQDAETASATGAGGQSAASTGSGVTSTSGPGSTTSNGQGGASVDPCEGLFEASCIASSPTCTPVYDDTCCPSCDPGGCADCVAYEFHHCASSTSVCSPATPPCGTVPDWACKGGSAVCGSFDGPPCGFTPGCVHAECALGMGCACIPEEDCSCRAVKAGSCTVLCDVPPPQCGPGFTAESDGSCYTGWCIPSDVCGVF